MYRTNLVNLSFKNASIYLGLLFLSFLFFPKFALFIFLAFIGGYIKYKRMITKLPLIFEPIFFFTVIIAKAIGFKYALIYILTANLIPEIMAFDVDHFTFTWIIQLLLYSFIAIKLKGTIVTIGLILLAIDFVLSTIIHYAGNNSLDYVTIAPISFLIFNLAYFWILGEILMRLL